MSLPHAEYIKDKNAVYFCTHVNGAFLRIDEADLESFQGREAKFAVDRSHVFYNGKILSNIENDGFQVLYKEYPMEFYVKNTRHAYILDGETLRAIDKADAQSFSAYDAQKVRATGLDAEDKNSFFKNGQIAKNK